MRNTYKIAFILAVLAMGLPGTTLEATNFNLKEGMVFVPADEFVMGIKLGDIKKILDDVIVDSLGKTIEKKHGGMAKYHFNATPQHKVRTSGFYIDKYEVTNTQYKEFCNATKRQVPTYLEDGKFQGDKVQHPVVNITWHDAYAYCTWKGKRLPKEEEWEHAARNRSSRLFPWGFSVKRKILKYANIKQDENGRQGTTEVGEYSAGAGPFQVMDMCGNVGEWTASQYVPYPGNQYPDEFYGTDRYVVRGGSWRTFSYESITTFRYKYTPDSYYNDLGFRCAGDEKLLTRIDSGTIIQR